jgi:hypothetical protein
MVDSASRPQTRTVTISVVVAAVPIVVAYLIAEFPFDAYCTNSSILPSCGLSAFDYMLRTVLIVLGALGLATVLSIMVIEARATRRSESRGNGRAPVSTAPFKPGWRRRPAIVVLVSVGIVAAALAALIVVPVPQQFSLRGVAIYDLQVSCPGVDTTQGTTVNFHWSAASSTGFAVVSCSANQVVYEGNGTAGSGSFVSVGGVYEFGSTCPGPEPCYPADVTGSFTSPLLPL